MSTKKPPNAPQHGTPGKGKPPQQAVPGKTKTPARGGSPSKVPARGPGKAPKP